MSDGNGAIGYGELASALAKAQARMPRIPKSRTAQIQSAKGSYSYKYADLSDILEAATPVLAEQGLAVSQVFDAVGETGCVLRSHLMHSSGAVQTSTLPIDWSGGSPQTLGSLITYMRRYSYCALIGITAEEDDDASSAEREARPNGREAAPKRSDHRPATNAETAREPTPHGTAGHYGLDLDGRWPVGKYRGKAMADIPTAYLEWAIEKMADKPKLKQAASNELDRRAPMDAQGGESGAEEPPF